MPSRSIIAELRDVSAYSAPNPQIAIYFDKADLSCLPKVHYGSLIIELLSAGPFQATIGLTKSNSPYLHSSLSVGGGTMNCTHALAQIGCGHGDALEFEVVVPRQHLRLKRILKGQGPPPRRGPQKRESCVTLPVKRAKHLNAIAGAKED